MINKDEQLKRFESDLAIRKEQGKSSMEIDTEAFSMSRKSSKECSGVALGFDRLPNEFKNIDIKDLSIFSDAFTCGCTVIGLIANSIFNSLSLVAIANKTSS